MVRNGDVLQSNTFFSEFIEKLFTKVPQNPNFTLRTVLDYQDFSKKNLWSTFSLIKYKIEQLRFQIFPIHIYFYGSGIYVNPFSFPLTYFVTDSSEVSVRLEGS